MKARYIIVEHRSPELYKLLRQQIKDAHAEIERLKHEHLSLERKYGWEINLNNELIDLCKRYNVPYRDTLDNKKHPF